MTSPWWWWEKALDGWFGRRAGQVAAAATLVALFAGVVHPALTEWLFRSYVNWGTHELMSWMQPMLRNLQHLRFPMPTSHHLPTPTTALHRSGFRTYVP